MILDATTKSIEVVLASAKTTNDCPWTVSYVDGTPTVYTAVPSYGNTNGTTAVTILAGPSSNARRVQEYTLFNADTVATTATIRYNNNGTTYKIHTVVLPVGSALVYVTGVGFYVLDSSGLIQQSAVRTTNDRLRQITCTIDGGGSVITTGDKTIIECPYSGTITAARIFEASGLTGSCVVDIWKAPYSSYPPTVSNTITASALPTLSSANKNQDTTLTGWSTAVAAGDIFKFHVNSVTTCQRVVVSLTVQTT